jgi:hypothetical protein
VAEQAAVRAKEKSEVLIKEHSSKISETISEKSGFNMSVFVSSLKDEFDKKKPPAKK